MFHGGIKIWQAKNWMRFQSSPYFQIIILYNHKNIAFTENSWIDVKQLIIKNMQFYPIPVEIFSCRFSYSWPLIWHKGARKYFSGQRPMNDLPNQFRFNLSHNSRSLSNEFFSNFCTFSNPTWKILYSNSFCTSF